jgi:hypothetical protein
MTELEARARIELANKGFAERFLGVLQGGAGLQNQRLTPTTFQPTTPHNR